MYHNAWGQNVTTLTSLILSFHHICVLYFNPFSYICNIILLSQIAVNYPGYSSAVGGSIWFSFDLNIPFINFISDHQFPKDMNFPWICVDELGKGE